MQIEKISDKIDIKNYLKKLGVDGGGVNILASKAKIHLISIKGLNVGAANILKQDALSIGADLAVPKGTIFAEHEYVDTLLIATTKHLKILAKKELLQPFGLKNVAKKLLEISSIKNSENFEIMGIVNANDDSFFAHSRFMDKSAIEAIEQMIEDGADIIDIGGVSSAPKSAVVDVDEELRRVKPILDAIKSQKLYERVAFSIDTYQPKVISYAMESGFSIVNDITGLRNDEVCRLCASYNATAVIMHMQGTPQTMQNNPKYDNILTDIYNFFEFSIQKAESFGVSDIIVDIGIGFGKTLDDNLKLIKNLEHFLPLGKKILVGASRKSMINQISESDVNKRLPGSLAIHLEAYRNGASIFRVHDVAQHFQALKVQKALDEIL